MINQTKKEAEAPSIIIIEDDDTMRDLIEDLLDDEGYDFTPFNSINDDVRVKVHPKNIIIVDVMIKGNRTAGVDFVLELKHKYPDFTDKNVIFISNFSKEPVKQKLKCLGVHYTWLSKPFDLLKIAKKIEEVKKNEKKRKRTKK